MSIEAAKVLEQSAQATNSNQPANTPENSNGVVTAPVATPPVDPQVSSKLEVLARREQAAVQAERLATKRMKEIDEKIAKITAFESAKATPLDALKMLGYSYDDITKAKLLDGEVPPEVEVKKLKTELDTFKQTQEQKEQEQAAREKKDAELQEQKAISNFKTDIGQFLKDNATRYELIQFEGEENLVFETIEAHYNRTIDPQTGVGKVLTKAEAADKVEAYLEKKYDESRKVNKVKTLFGLRQEKAPVVAKPETTQRQPPKTLTNNLSATPEKPRTVLMTDEERVQKAIAYAKALRAA